MGESDQGSKLPPNRLLGGFGYVSRTFEGGFKDNPYVLDTDANLYIGPADNVPRDEHTAVELIYHFLNQTGRTIPPFRDLLRNRALLMQAFRVFDDARAEVSTDEFRVLIFGTYDGEVLQSGIDDDLPAGPCGKTVNEVKRRLYDICAKSDPHFLARRLGPEDAGAEAKLAAR